MMQSKINQNSKQREDQFKIRTGPAGIHLFNRITGTNILFDEIEVPCCLWSKAPRQVSIALTNACDLTCVHCYAPKNHAVLNLDRVMGWLDELDSNGCIGVGFGGGEPTIYPKLPELCFYAARKTTLAVTMTTHAHHLSDHLLDKLAGNLHFVRVSMDGINTTYESIRRRPFAVLIERIKALSKITSFGINFVVNSKTIGDLDTAVQIATEFKAAEFLLLPEVSVKGIGGIDNETIRRLQAWIIKHRGRVPLTISETSADGLPVCNPFSSETGLTSFAHIDASGVLKRTSYDAQGVEISEEGIMEAIYKLNTIN